MTSTLTLILSRDSLWIVPKGAPTADTAVALDRDRYLAMITERFGNRSMPVQPPVITIDTRLGARGGLRVDGWDHEPYLHGAALRPVRIAWS